jgi:peptidoglycan LD-endopeptidase LytH
MLRLAVLVVLLGTAAWLGREGSWLPARLALAPTTTPHEAYRRALDRAGLTETALGRAWLDAGEHATELSRTLRVPADHPFRRTFTFDAHVPQAWGLRMSVKRGQRVEVTASTLSSTVPAEAFVDVFTVRDATDADHEIGTLRGATYEVAADGEVVVRVQPELLAAGRVEVTARAAPALRFPVAKAQPNDLQSIFGDPRDAGRRQHEGVDIFARRGTHVISASEGVVIRVGETRLGGRVVWVWDTGRGLRLYYAHLDEQLVTRGQRVRVGDVIGTVGNTGNARTTAPHLHFGIYENGRGAIDPYWFIARPRATRAAAGPAS